MSLDFTPAARQMAVLLDGVSDSQLGDGTPCEKYTLGDLVEHVSGLARAFAAAAAKEIGPITAQAPAPDMARLSLAWKAEIPVYLDRLVEAWREPDAWTGMTQVGGVDLPGPVAGVVGLTELVIHGWDIARATGQPYAADETSLAACLEFVSATATPERAAEREGIFGPPKPVTDGTGLLDRVIALSGRDPQWSPSS